MFDGCPYKSNPQLHTYNELGYMIRSRRFYFLKDDPTYILTASLSELFSLPRNKASPFLQTFYHLLPDVSLAGTHTKFADPIAYFLTHGSFNNARNRIKHTASRNRHASLKAITRSELRDLLQKPLIASSSYPSISMSCSILSHRRPNNLPRQPQKEAPSQPFYPSQCPMCLCGATINPHI